MNEEAFDGVIFRRSPLPTMVIGYHYPKGEFGECQEKYRVEVSKEEYERVVKRVKRQGGTNRQMSEKMYQHFARKA